MLFLSGCQLIFINIWNLNLFFFRSLVEEAAIPLSQIHKKICKTTHWANELLHKGSCWAVTISCFQNYISQCVTETVMDTRCFQCVCTRAGLSCRCTWGGRRSLSELSFLHRASLHPCAIGALINRDYMMTARKTWSLPLTLLILWMHREAGTPSAVA